MSELTPTAETRRITLRDLPLAARITLSAFLVSVGIGYISALVQLHFQHASPGNVLPTGDDAVHIYHKARQPKGLEGGPPRSRMELLIEADESLKVTATGQMRTVFHRDSSGWENFVDTLAEEMAMADGRDKPTDADLAKATEKLMKEREGERQAVLEWVRASAPKQAFEDDRFVISPKLASEPITEKFVIKEDDKVVGVKIQKLLDSRCTRCHKEGAKADNVPLETYEEFAKWCEVPKPTADGKVEPAPAISLDKLAQTTHVHLLGFSMLYGMTGLILAFASYHGAVRLILCPLPLIAQVIDISCWWLARIDPAFAGVIMITGGIVAVGLLLHILLSVFDMYGWMGKGVFVVLLLVGLGGAGVVHQKYVGPYLERARQTSASH